jgi:hypothetical protein
MSTRRLAGILDAGLLALIATGGAVACAAFVVYAMRLRGRR